jgi:6-phosphofructokinase 1
MKPPENTVVMNLGERKVKSPIKLSRVLGDKIANYVKDEERVVYDNSLCVIDEYIESGKRPPSFEKAGPREKIYFDPKNPGQPL